MKNASKARRPSSIAEEEIDAVVEAFEDCERSALRSADRNLPADASATLRLYLPRLIYKAAIETIEALPPWPSREQAEASRRSMRVLQSAILAAELAVGESILNPAANRKPMLLHLAKAARSLARARRMAASMEASMEAFSAPRKGRRSDEWMAVFTTSLGLWWYERGWIPTTSKLGAFVTVLRYVGHADVATTSRYLQTTRVGLHRAMKVFEEHQATLFAHDSHKPSEPTPTWASEDEAENPAKLLN